MKKIKLSMKAAKICDYTLWTIAVVFAFWADWRAGVALLAFDAMRAFEDIASEMKISASGKELLDKLMKAMDEDKDK